MRGRILVVDDDDDVLEVYRLLLRKKYDVVTMSNGESLLAEDSRPPFDIAILDHRIGKVLSTDVIPILKNKPEWKSTHFVLHSGIPDLKTIAAGCLADGYLPKPSPINEILTYIDRVLESKR